MISVERPPQRYVAATPHGLARYGDQCVVRTVNLRRTTPWPRTPWAELDQLLDSDQPRSRGGFPTFRGGNDDTNR
jgi:hypothetical protein